MSSSEHKTNPQVQRTHRLMLDAARGLLSEHGPEAVTHLRVAEAAGVARATVYRHWPERSDILLDLVRRGADLHPASPPADLPISDRMTRLLQTFAAALNGDSGQIMTAMISLAEWDKDVFAALERMTAFGPKLLRDLLRAGLEEGSITPGVDIDLLTDRLIGPLYLRRLLYHDEITATYVDHLVANTLTPHLSA
ncbi:MAG: TetR family transcriptional regulator [Gammaproteobacteria bacterium]|nr:TetR family transcriptional regulator [Gammaproteobacteria bacterium]